jgi:hypothetical protein
MHVYELRPRKDHGGVDLIFDALPFGRLWYAGPEAVANAKIPNSGDSATQLATLSFTAGHTMP